MTTEAGGDPGLGWRTLPAAGAPAGRGQAASGTC